MRRRRWSRNNRAFHRMLRDGVPVEYRRDDGSIAGDHVRLIDFDNPDANDWLAVNQFTVIEGQTQPPAGHRRLRQRPAARRHRAEERRDEDTDIWFAAAYNQLQTYKPEIPSLLHYNAVLVISDGLEARIGSLTANQEWFKAWRTIEGEVRCAELLRWSWRRSFAACFEQRRFLDLLRYFIVFEDDPDSGALHKKMAGYHQFHAVNAAVEETVRATAKDRRGAKQPALTGRARCRAASRATAASASSGTRRAPARASRWSSTPAASSCIRRWRTRRSSC